MANPSQLKKSRPTHTSPIDMLPCGGRVEQVGQENKLFRKYFFLKVALRQSVDNPPFGEAA